jgi:hypothetical protein
VNPHRLALDHHDVMHVDAFGPHAIGTDIAGLLSMLVYEFTA